jgi:hypothetical protein
MIFINIISVIVKLIFDISRNDMANKSNIDDLNLGTISGRLAFAIKTKGPKFIAENTSISIATASRLSTENGKTTLENAAEIAIATGFELRWIALGQGPQMNDQSLWDETSQFTKIAPLDPTQKIDISFEPEYLSNELGVKAENCAVWEVNYNTNLKNLKKGHTVLIHKIDVVGGLLLTETHGKKQIVFSRINMDGSLSIELNDGLIQDIEKDDIKNLNVIGEIIWTGGQS